MARWVSEIMNPELFYLRDCDSVTDAVHYLRALDISGAPVLSPEGALIGMVSLRDLLRDGGNTVEECMSTPVVTVREHDTIEQAAEVLGHFGFHRIPVVSDAGTVVGVVSALDLLRGLQGIPVTHPSAFPHYDRATGVNWTSDSPLESEAISTAPAGPGILVLRLGNRRLSERDVWVESAANVQERLQQLLNEPQEDTYLQRLIETHAAELRFRAAAIRDAQMREQTLSVLLHRFQETAERLPLTQ